MDNWDRRPELVVVYSEGLPYFVVEGIAINNLQLSKDVMFTTDVEGSMSDAVVFNTGYIKLSHLASVLDCLEDHRYNTLLNEWMTHQEDVGVTIDGDDLEVSVFKGTYYAQNCKVTAYELIV